MGLFSLDSLDDPKKLAMLEMGLSMLAPKPYKTSVLGDIGQSGLAGLQAYSQARTAERANRQNELQQLAGSYKVLKDIDQQAFLESQLPGGKPYQPIAGLQEMEARLGTLASGKSMQTGLGASPQPAPVQAPPSAPAPPQPGMAPPSQSPMADPNYQPSMVRAPQAPAQGQSQPQPQAQVDLPAMLAAANIPVPLAQMMFRTGQQAKLYEMIGEALKPKNGPAGVTRINPQTGQVEIVAGNASPGQVPFARNSAGQLVANPIQGAAEEIARAEGMKTSAVEGAKAPFNFNTFNTGPGGAPQVMSTAMLRDLESQRMPQSPQSQPPQPPQPPQQPQQAPQSPGVARVDVTQPSRTYVPNGGGGLSGPNPVTVAGDKAQAEDLAKFYAGTFITTQQAGLDASKSLQKYDRIDQLMKDVETGKLTPAGMQVSAYAQSLGIPLDPKLPNKQAAEALTGQIALELRNPSGGAGMPGALSDNDLKFLRSMTPGMAQTTEGRKMIIETKRKLLQRDQQVAQIARDYRKKTGGPLDDGFTQALSDFSTGHPLFPQEESKSQSLPFNLPPGWKAEQVK